jgi:hypothetical protein
MRNTIMKKVPTTFIDGSRHAANFIQRADGGRDPELLTAAV